MKKPEPNKSNPGLHYEVHGTSGPYILMVHGLLSSRAQWLPNLDALVEFSRPVVIELYGHGRSPAPKGPEHYAPDNYVSEFECIREELEIERWFICGQSLGAALTLRYAVCHPDRVVAQVFTNSMSALTTESYDKIMEEIVKQLEKDGRAVIDNFPLHPSKNRRLKPEIKDVLVSDAGLIGIRGFSHTGLYTVTASSVRDLIGNNRVPVLLIAGRFDKQFAPFIEPAAKLIPNLETVILDAGHAVNLDAPEEFNNALKIFFSRFSVPDD